MQPRRNLADGTAGFQIRYFRGLLKDRQKGVENTRSGLGPVVDTLGRAGKTRAVPCGDRSGLNVPSRHKTVPRLPFHRFPLDGPGIARNPRGMMSLPPDLRALVVAGLVLGLGLAGVLPVCELAAATALGEPETLVERLCGCHEEARRCGGERGSQGSSPHEGERLPSRTHTAEEQAEVLSVAPVRRQALERPYRSLMGPSLRSDAPAARVFVPGTTSLVAMQVRLDC